MKPILKKNMEYKIVYEKEAAKEIENIYLYIKNTLLEEHIDQKVVSNIINKIRELKYFPLANNTNNQKLEFLF